VTSIDPTSAIVMWKKPYDKKLLLAKPPPFEPYPFKPTGVWYATGDEWLEWCRTDMPGWIRPNLYRLTLDKSRMLIMRTASELRAFTKKYAHPDVLARHNAMHLDWARVANEYTGIEIAPYIYECRFDLMWYYGWDVASGCVWDKSIIQCIDPIEMPAKYTVEGVAS
jgi:hypothetical protein